MQLGRQTGFQHNRCRERTRNGRGPNQIREMLIAEFSTLAEPALRSAPALIIPVTHLFEIYTKRRGACALPLVTEAGVPHPRSELEVCVCTASSCGEFQIGALPEKKKRQQGCRTPDSQNFIRQIFEDRQVSSRPVYRPCLDRVFT